MTQEEIENYIYSKINPCRLCGKKEPMFNIPIYEIILDCCGADFCVAYDNEIKTEEITKLIDTWNKWNPVEVKLDNIDFGKMRTGKVKQWQESGRHKEGQDKADFFGGRKHMDAIKKVNELEKEVEKEIEKEVEKEYYQGFGREEDSPIQVFIKGETIAEEYEKVSTKDGWLICKPYDCDFAEWYRLDRISLVRIPDGKEMM